ncbi:hypothetical protein [Brevundimonas sp.]|uniref:hypothetical protein n=1 Tax=Brevundimonas sp. TaxID=1871086 RepID=UPI001D2A0864|nr:hypothetical protein [Brevundimonas sp.]MBA4000156.1 hypothetical protein [Brevundimonas sp.]
MTIVISEDEIIYFDAVVQRLDLAIKPVRREIIYRDGTAPRPNDCHANVARWAAENPNVVPAYGWLVESDDGWFRQLVAHSLLAHADGRYIDITPMDPHERRFVVHIGPQEGFFGLLPRFSALTWPVPQLAGGVTQVQP